MGGVWHLWGEGKAENCWDSGPGQGKQGRREAGPEREGPGLALGLLDDQEPAEVFLRKGSSRST